MASFDHTQCPRCGRHVPDPGVSRAVDAISAEPWLFQAIDECSELARAGVVSSAGFAQSEAER